MFFVASFSVVAMSCGNAYKQHKATSADSMAVTMAVFPSLDALPIMVANDSGILDSLGISLNINIYRSQMDAEKALAEGKVDVAMTDMFRVAWWQWKKKPIRFAFTTKRPLYIVPNRILRISKVEQLDDRMIALSRFSLSDYYCDKIVNLMTKRKGQILRPQINSVELRTKMLLSGQLDAAILPQMQTYKAQNAGYPAIKVDKILPDGFAGFAFNTNSLKENHKHKQILLLQKAYNTAVARLHQMKTLSGLETETQQVIFLDGQTNSQIDPQKDFANASPIDKTQKAEALRWLKERNIVGATYLGDTLEVTE